MSETEKGERLRRFFKQKGVLPLIILFCLGAIFLIFSGLWSDDAQKEQKVEESDALSYTESLEKRLTTLLSGMSGVGETRVMIVLEDCGESNFVRDETSSVSGGENGSEQSATTHILQTNRNGEKSAIAQSQTQPRVRGVSVVCSGGGDTRIKLKVLEAVCALFGIGENRVSVTN